jgi:hypothetical protein
VLARITVTVPVALLEGQALPAPAEVAADGLAGALQAVADAAAAAVRQAGSHGVTGPGDACTHEQAVPGYRIPDRLRALIEARDQDCGFPICRRPASACDLDHTVPYDQGGLTCRCNLSGGCRHHHRMKTLTSWRLRQPSPGTLIWTTPSRLTWTVTPPPHDT